MTNLPKITNNLRFKDTRDQKFMEFQVNKFVTKFINHEQVEKVEIGKDYIYLFKYGQSGFSHFNISGLQPKTSREMLIYITGLNYDY